MKKISITFISLLMIQFAFSQTAKDSITNTINNLFVAMKNGDTVLLKSCFTQNAILQTVATKDGQTIVQNETVNDFVKSISQIPKGSADEKIISNTIQIDGALASSWSPYNFYFKEKFSHCGIDHFVLVRINNEWKIQYLIDTRRKNGCNP